MEFSFENVGVNTYLVYELKDNDNIDTMSLGMLTNNKIPGLAETQFMQMDAKKFLKFNISSRISAKEFFSGFVNKKRLLGVFKGIIDALLSADDYMIDKNSIVLDLDYIFSNVSTCETVLICLPIINENNQNKNLCDFFRSIMFSTKFDQTENCDHVTKILNYLNGTPIFSLVDFKKLLEDLQRPSTEAPKTAARVPEKGTVNPAVPPNNRPNNREPLYSKNQPQYRPNQNQPVNNVNNTVNKKLPYVNNQVPKPEPVPPAKKQGYAIPNKPKDQNQQPTGQEEKKISLFYLLQHYNPENKALYEAQKNAKKGGTSNNNKKQAEGQKYNQPVKYDVPGMQRQQAAPINPAYNRPNVAANPNNIPNNVPNSATNYVPNNATNNIPNNMPNNMQRNMPSATQNYNPLNQPQNPAPNNFYNQSGERLNFGETTILNNKAAGETTVLNGRNIQGMDNNKPLPYIIRKRTGEKVLINKPVFRIGKERSYVDYFIGNNTAISRGHANIVVNGDKYYIVDTNSLNHTFVNGNMINSGTQVQIFNGDKIRLANEDFEFIIM